MNKSRLLGAVHTFLILTTLIAPINVQAASVLLHQPGTTSDFSFDDEGRQTLIEVLNTITITQLGAEIDPGASNPTFDWRIYESDVSATVGSVTFSLLDISFASSGMQIYDTSVSINLNPGYYLLELLSQAPEESDVLMARYNEIDQSLPFVTTDGNIRAIDGFSTGLGQSAGEADSLQQNSILPAFSVTVATVPVPSAAWLFGSGLLGLIGIARRKKTA